MKETAIRHFFAEERVERFRRRYRPANVAAALIGFLVFFLHHGRVFPDSWLLGVSIAEALCLTVMVGETVGDYVMARGLRGGFRLATVDTLLILVGAVATVVFGLLSPWAGGVLEQEQTLDVFTLISQGGLMALVSTRLLRLFNVITRLVRSPLLVFMGSFVGIILFGAVLLSLPGAVQDRPLISPVDALFMSTSATCVTGLSVIDIGRELTLFGQLVILALIQVGGLGIMTFAAFFALAFGRGMGVRDTAAMGEMLNVKLVGRVGRTVAWILGITIVSEALGVFLLYGHWVDHSGAALPADQQVWYSVFHSISSFCNAGFGLHSDSLVRYAGDWPLVLSVTSLVVLGGLGFTVVLDLATFRFWATPALRRLPLIRRKVRKQPIPRLSLQTKIVLPVTGLLLLAGAAGFWLLESSASLEGRTISEQAAASLFHGMTPRTAGFNTVDLNAMRPATHYFTILFMLVGASPGSTGGGLKTTTFVVMFLTVISMFRGRTPEMFRRRIPEELTRKSLVMLVLALTFLNAATFSLMLTESRWLGDHDYGFEKITFEVVSAFCTVGLSTGITSELTWAGKLIIIACMFVGRVGPLTLVLAIGRRVAQRYQYPDENIMIG